MNRMNSEGVPRSDLLWALGRVEMVAKARNRDRCLLCSNGSVNEAGLCEPCVALLDDDETKLVERWRAGVGP